MGSNRCLFLTLIWGFVSVVEGGECALQCDSEIDYSTIQPAENFSEEKVNLLKQFLFLTLCSCVTRFIIETYFSSLLKGILHNMEPLSDNISERSTEYF